MNWKNSLILYYTGTSRDSAKIIDEQIKSTKEKNSNSLEGMHTLETRSICQRRSVF